MGMFDNVGFDNDDSFIDVSLGGAKVEPSVADKEPAGNADEDGLIEVEVDNTSKEYSGDEDTLDSDEFKEETDDETPPNKDKGGSSSSSPFKPFAKTLSEEGFLPSITDEEFDLLAEELGGETQALMELSRRSIQDDIEEYKRTAEGDFAAFIKARDSGLDLNQWANVYEAKKAYAEIDDTKIDDDETLQKTLIANDLRNKGFSEDDILDTIDAFDTTGKLAINAKKSHKNLLKYVDAQESKLNSDKIAAEDKSTKDHEVSMANLRKEVDTITEIVPGIKINKQTKDKIYSSITTPVKTGLNGEQYNLAMAKRAEDPFKYAIIENYLIELGVFDGKWDKIVSRTKSKAISELEKSLRSDKNTDFKGGKNTLGSGSSDSDIDFRLPKFKTF